MGVTDRSFIRRFKNKLHYVEMKLKFNRTSNLCTSGFMSYFTTALWAQIGCHDVIDDNYFLCEAPAGNDASKPKYLFSNNVCGYGYTFLNRSCWLISTLFKQKSVSVHVHTEALDTPTFYCMLSAWSLGNAYRRSIVLYTNETHTKCLKTSDFDHQYFKTWTMAYNCKPLYYLVKRATVTYRTMCHGK